MTITTCSSGIAWADLSKAQKQDACKTLNSQQIKALKSGKATITGGTS